MKNVRLNIFDITSCINTDGGASYYNTDFLQPLSDILAYNDDIMQVNIILGVGFAKNLLSSEEYDILCNILSNANNIPNNTFIVVENYDIFMESKETELFNLFDRKNGFWYGDDIENQEFYEIDNILDTDLENKTPEKLYVIYDSKYVLIRAIGYKGDTYE